jgi:hypothetical protein
MSGPIVRSGPSPEFTKNWDSVFNKKQGKKKAAAKPAKAAAKSVKAKAPAKAKKKAIAKRK